MRAPVRRLLALGALVVALTACSVDATVTVRMHADGSGAVSVRVDLDGDAVRAAEIAGGKLEDRVRLGDLRDAGWTVGPWRRTTAGGASVTITKPFRRPEQVGAVIRELNGADGPLRGFGARREASTFTTSWQVRGRIDLRTIDLGVTSDQQLVAALTAKRVDPGLVEQRIAGQAVTGLRIHGRVELPDGAVREVTVRPGAQATLRASGDHTDWSRVVLLVGGVLAALAAITVVAVGESRARRRRRPRRIPTRAG
ncbi:MAG: hypothetical protein ACXVLO_08465 [Acidimicrobiia bacterium]